MNKKILSLSKKDKKIGGVAGGISEYLDIDSTIIRLIWIFGTLIWGVGLLAYFIAWIVMPEK
jgi:phage shock protein C